MPWWTKIAAKLFLSRLPVPYGFWSSIGIFRHGDMADPKRAIKVFTEHLARARAINPVPDGFSMLELGPGDSVLSAAVARSCGAAASWLVDAGSFADRDPALFHALDKALPASGLRPLHIPKDADFDGILRHLSARYLTSGLQSLAEIPSGSVDLIWSSVVLEHVLAHEFDALVREFHRVLSPKGVMSHAIDLRDHLGGSLNNLRFSRERWECPSWRRAGFYTNRLSKAEILASFERGGFVVRSVTDDLWPAPPLAREKMHESFRHRTDDELRVAGFDVLLLKRG